MGNPWNGTYVFSSGNLKLDLLHNFFLECGARANKIRVYEMVDDPVAREMVGYLPVRGGTHILAYAKALEVLSGVDISKLLPIPDISNKRFPEAKKHEAKGLHQVMIRKAMEARARGLVSMPEWRAVGRAEAVGAAIEGRLTFTPRIDDAGEAYEITGVANVAALIGSNTLDGLASPAGFEPAC
jgi:Mn-containing catalase